MTRIAVDPGRLIGRLDRRVPAASLSTSVGASTVGVFDEGSALADRRGFRRDVLGLLRNLRLGVLRWPGGTFASNYHWADGIGPKDARPRRPTWLVAASRATGSAPVRHRRIPQLLRRTRRRTVHLPEHKTGTLPEVLA